MALEAISHAASYVAIIATDSGWTFHIQFLNVLIFLYLTTGKRQRKIVWNARNFMPNTLFCTVAS